MSDWSFRHRIKHLNQRLVPLYPAAQIILFAAIIFVSVIGGVWVRDKTWETTYNVRFNGDIDNGFNWGMQANELGYFSIYERLGEPELDKRRIDYAPLRLGVMSWWVRGMYDQRGDPVPLQRQPSRAFHARLLKLNSAMELATAVAIFFIARHLRRRSLQLKIPPVETVLPNPTLPRHLGFWPGTWIALLVAIITWFNPLIIFEAHAWPQWDIWPMPFFLFALYCCFHRRWLVAGLLLGLGANFKGQLLIVAWVLPIWAIFLGDWRGAIKLVTGMAAAVMLIGLPWIITQWDPQHTPTRAFDLLDRNFNRFGIIFITVQVALAFLAPLVIWKRIFPTLIAFAFASAAWLTMTYYGGTDYWLASGFGVGTWNYQAMIMGPTSNLAGLLDRMGWQNIHGKIFAIGTIDLTVKQFLLSIFIILCLASAWIASRHERKRDPRLIISLCLPWLLFYALPAQIHERYLFYFATCAALFLICSPGWFLLGLFTTALGLIAVLNAALMSNGIATTRWEKIPTQPWGVIPRETWGFLRYLLEPTHPGIAWALLLAVAIFMVGLYSPRKQD